MGVARTVSHGAVRRLSHVLTRSTAVEAWLFSLADLRALQLDVVSGDTESVPDMVAHSDHETQNDPGSLRPLGHQPVENEVLTVASSYLSRHRLGRPVCCDCCRSREGRHI